MDKLHMDKMSILSGEWLLRVAWFSGGKESLYAALQRWPPDLFLFLVYEFSEPSPHIVNLKHAVLSAASMRIPVAVVRLDRGREFEQTVRFLEKVGAREMVAGDVNIVSHLKYMERLAEAAGARLYEPLWGQNTEELLRREIEDGLRPAIIGFRRDFPREWLCRVIDEDTVEGFLEDVKKHGIDPVGERGEYHSLVVSSKVHREALEVKLARVVVSEKQVIAVLE